MIQFFLSALPIALIWVALTGHISLDSFVLGYALGCLILAILRRMGIRFDSRLSLDQPVALVIYIAGILWSGLRSSLKVARLVLSPQIKLETGVVMLQTGDLSEQQLLTALSAHSINTTPGEVVIDISDGGVLYVHCLDLAASRAVMEREQERRLHLLRRIIGEREQND